MGSSIDYYEKRERQERELAEKASDPATSRAHATMAQLYRKIVDNGGDVDARRLRQVIDNG